MSDTPGIAFLNGIHDRHAYGLLRVEQLYHRPLVNRIAWRLGWEFANVLTTTKLRTNRAAEHMRSKS